MSETRPRKVKGTQHFWRACRYLWPYRRMISVSIAAAFFVGFALAGGLGGMVPIMRVLINGDTVVGWMDRQVVQHKLGVTFAQADLHVVQIADVSKDSPAADAGLKVGQIIDSAPPGNAPARDPYPPTPEYHAGEVLRNLAWSKDASVTLMVSGRPATISPHQREWYEFYVPIGLRVVEWLPINPVKAVAAVFVILAIISIFGQSARFFQEYLSDKAGILAVNDVRRLLYDHVLRVPLRFFGTEGTSDVTSRLVSDCAILQDGFKQVLGPTIQEPIKAMMAFGVALYLSWKLTLAIVVFAPVMLVIVKKFGKKMRRASRAALQSSSAMLGQIEGTLLGIRVVKGASAERFERRRYSSVMWGLTLEQMRMSRIDAFSAPVLETAIMLMAGCVLIYATWMVTGGDLTADRFFTVMASLAVIAESLRRASKATNALHKSNAAAQRVFQTLDTEVERPRVGRSKARPLAPLRQQIEFRELTFSYPNSTSPAVSEVSLTVPKGQSIAIVGRNGSGKTTLLALLERFFDPQKGSILIDGIDIRAATLPSLRKQISIVTQESVIFPGTIAQNIAYAHPFFAKQKQNSPRRAELMAQIEDAARRAFAHEFIMEKPNGYETVLGELGGQLSGGQKQRLCIARAIFRQCPILILDEATSQVDAESEHLIQQAVEQLMHQRTTFVIAHRFSTIISADSIVVMERGRIVGQGKHDELLRTCQIYQQLYERQIFAMPTTREMAS